MRYDECEMGISQTPELTVHNRPRSEGPSLRGLDMLLVLLRARLHIALITFISLLLGVGIAFSLKPTFMATATILPPQAPQSAAAALVGQLGSLAGLGGGAGGLLKNPTDTYVGILEGRTIADRIIGQFHLQSLWKQTRLGDARKILQAHVQFEAAKDGLIVITVTDRDPKLASDMANAFVDELYRVDSDQAVTEAVQRRKFFDQQLLEEKDALEVAENDLRATQERTGLIELSGQSEMAIRSIAETRAEIESREVEMQAMRLYATEQNPDLALLRKEIDTLRQQLASLQNNQQLRSLGDTQVPAGRVPVEAVEYLRKLREVKYHETLVGLLSRQYEAARLDEAKSAPIIQVIDRAVPPDRKSGPPRMLIALGFGVIGFCVACCWAFLRQALVVMRQYPDSAERLDQVCAILRVRL